jgi:signal transduction histidine kinase
MTVERPSSPFTPAELQHLGLVGLGLIHELSTPLSTSVMSLQLLIESLESGESTSKPQLIERLHGEVDRLKAAAATLERFRRWLSTEAPDSHRLSLTESVQKALATMRPVLAQLGLVQPELQIDSSQDVLIDPIWFERALCCLLLNAGQASQSGRSDPARVRITLSNDGQAGLVYIDDNGPGLEAVPPLGYSDKSAGVGVGLNLAVYFIKSMSGEFTLGKSDLGGCRVAITVPAAQPTQ